jgi:dolichol-phosphate mannosyltransferase
MSQAAKLTANSAPVTTSTQYDGIELSIIVPTFNERHNIQQLITRLSASLEDVAWEVIFVDDDSPDGTADLVRRIAKTDRRVRCLQRIGRCGLPSACTEGMLASSAPYFAVMDADMKHDETLLPDMLALLREGDLDLVVGSRYVAHRSVGECAASRTMLGRLATKLSQLCLRIDLTDPMSGFFMMRSECLHSAVRRLSAVGFKILLDVCASSPEPLRSRELPYVFRQQLVEESKLDGLVAWEYLMVLLDKLLGHVIPARFISFAMVGAVGVIVHMAILTALFRWEHAPFVVGQAGATVVALVNNFALNNILTYGDRRLRGWGLLRGWISFMVICGVGAFANVTIASYLFRNHTDWVLSALCGILVSAVWSYSITSMYTWKAPQRA